MHTRALHVTAALLLLSVVLVLSACGGSGKTTATVSAGAGFETYTDPTYGFSFVYPNGWQIKGSGQAQASVGASSEYMLGLFNPKGTVAEGSYIDVMDIQLYRLNAPVDQSMRSQLKPEIESVYSNLQEANTGWSAVDELTDVSLGDLWGWKKTFSCTVKGTDCYTRFYALFSGDLEYQLLVQASTKNWDGYQSVFDTFVTSFRAGSGNVTTTGSSK